MILSLQGFHEKEQKIKMQFNNNSTYSFALRTKELPLLFSKHDGTIRQIRWLVSRVNEEIMKYTFVEKKRSPQSTISNSVHCYLLSLQKLNSLNRTQATV